MQSWIEHITSNTRPEKSISGPAIHIVKIRRKRSRPKEGERFAITDRLTNIGSVDNQTSKGITMTTLLKRVVPLGFWALAAAVLMPTESRAAEPLRGWGFPHHISSREQAEALPRGSKIAMSCVKCKTVQVRDVDNKGAFLDWFTPNKKDVCPGCGGHWGYVVYGKGSRHGDWVHTCSKCGDKSMFCCSTEPGKKTKGM